jgi:hypothetical protein
MAAGALTHDVAGSTATIRLTTPDDGPPSPRRGPAHAMRRDVRHTGGAIHVLARAARFCPFGRRRAVLHALPEWQRDRRWPAAGHGFQAFLRRPVRHPGHARPSCRDRDRRRAGLCEAPQGTKPPRGRTPSTRRREGWRHARPPWRWPGGTSTAAAWLGAPNAVVASPSRSSMTVKDPVPSTAGSRRPAARATGA